MSGAARSARPRVRKAHPVVRRGLAPSRGEFVDARYRNKWGTRHYKLFLPASAYDTPLPLIVMLHGCTQSAEDFASATRMNDLAVRHQFAVAYPAQSLSANRSKCWNWFQASDQRRGRGEPAIIAGLTRHLVRQYGFDCRRVYVGGLSAGGAMAVVLGHAYPDMYAAVGVHSGLPLGVAHDVASAFAAMRGESNATAPLTISPRQTPAFVIHGDEDNVVHPHNGQRLLDQFTQRKPLHARIERLVIDGSARSRRCTRTVVRDEAGVTMVEHWLVHGAGHAWFGGDRGSAHTDTRGPDASAEMVRFFFEHRLDSQLVRGSNSRSLKRNGVM